MKTKSYFTFNPTVAADVGCTAAAVLDAVAAWIISNANNNSKKHYHDGKYWTFGAVRYWQEQLWFLSARQIETALNKLIEHGYLIKGNFNRRPGDQTSWYTMTAKTEDLYVMTEKETPKRRTRRTAAKSDDITPDIQRFIDKWNSYIGLTHVDPRGMRLGDCEDIQQGIDTYGLEDLLDIVDTFYNTAGGWYSKNEKLNNIKWFFGKSKSGERNILKFANEAKTNRDKINAIRAKETAEKQQKITDYRTYLIDNGIYEPMTGVMDWDYFDTIRDKWPAEIQIEIENKYQREKA